MHFKRINVERWQQFDSIDLDLSSRLTILTGANGSGKSTLLGTLARHNGWDVAHLAVPRQEKASGVVRFFSRFFKGLADETQSQVRIGSIEYSTGGTCDMLLPTGQNSAQYQLVLSSMQPVPSFFYSVTSRQLPI